MKIEKHFIAGVLLAFASVVATGWAFHWAVMAAQKEINEMRGK